MRAIDTVGHDVQMTNALRVMVTAGAAGIGAVIASTFAERGARVHVCDLSEPSLAALAARQPGVTGSIVDLSDGLAVTQWCSDVVSDLGGVDVLVNNAGVAGPTGDIEQVQPDEWRQCLAVGLDSHYLTARSIVPVMKQQRAGSIINLSSTAGQFGYGRRAPYAAVKWAVIGLTKSLAIELGPFDVTVNAICPGAVRGDRMDRVIAAEAQTRNTTAEAIEAEYTRSQSIARFVSPQEIADMCVFLASPQSRMVSGQVIAVDGHTETFHIT